MRFGEFWVRATDGPKMAKSGLPYISGRKVRSLILVLNCRLKYVFRSRSAVGSKLSEPAPLRNMKNNSGKLYELIWNFQSRKNFNPERVPQCSIRGRNRVFGPRLPLWHRLRDQREPWSRFGLDDFRKFLTFFVTSGVKYDIKIYPFHHPKSRNFGENLFAPLVPISHIWPNKGS